VPFSGKSQQVPDRVVRKIIGLDSGRVYREDELLEAQRTLYRTEAYQHVSIIPDTATSPTDSVVDIRALLAENTTRSARLGAGYGTLDCFRVTAELSNYNFLHAARRIDLTTRLSKIGRGDPLSGLDALCPQARRDPFSANLNYYLGATLRQPLYSRLRFLPTITVFSERVSEYNAYLRTTTIGGIASIDWRKWRTVPVTFAYSLDLGRTEAQPALFCAVFNVCDRDDRARLQENQRLAVISGVVSRDRSNNFLSPTRGYQWRVEARHASGDRVPRARRGSVRSQLWNYHRIHSAAGASLRRRADKRPRIPSKRARLRNLHLKQLLTRHASRRYRTRQCILG
jgi:outer membrane protein insertion porin family/translocation and assembly module TamA